MSLPLRGAWIEISYAKCKNIIKMQSLPLRGAWIEIYEQGNVSSALVSLPLRGAWIEM